jgi:hypothetical protein
MRDYLMAIAIFVNAAKGIAALQLGRDLDVSYKTTFVLSHKLRKAVAAGAARCLRCRRWSECCCGWCGQRWRTDLPDFLLRAGQSR